MSETASFPATLPPPVAPGLTQGQRVIDTFVAPSKTFLDIRRDASWWLPFLITLLAGACLYGAITTKITWKQIYDTNQENAPAFAKNMMSKMTPEQRAEQDRRGPVTQEITWALSPLGLLLINLAAAGVLLGTINFGFGGKARFGTVLAVTMYAGLVSWVIRMLLGTIAIFAGIAPEAFNVQNFAGTNLGYYLNKAETPAALYALATYIDPFTIWNLVLTSIGLAIVAGIKRSSGYIAVFGWWLLILLLGTASAAAFA